MTILITGSSGKTAYPLTVLCEKTHPVLVATRSPNRESPHTLVEFDWHNPATYNLPFEHSSVGSSPINAVYIVAPEEISPAPAAINFINVAWKKGVKRFVLLSAVEVEEGGPLLGKAHAELRRIAEQDNGISWMVLRPSFFMENFSSGHHVRSIQSLSKIYSAAGKGRLPFVSTQDIAAVAYRGLTDENMYAGEVFITADRSFSYDEVAAMMSKALGRVIKHECLSSSDFQSMLLHEEVPEELAEYLVEMDRRVSTNEFDKTVNTVREICEREPRSFERYLEDNAQIWR